MTDDQLESCEIGLRIFLTADEYAKYAAPLLAAVRWPSDENLDKERLITCRTWLRIFLTPEEFEENVEPLIEEVRGD